jgi:hypothetical protein
MSIDGIEFVCTNVPNLKVAKCRGLNPNPNVFRCDYCAPQYDLTKRKANSGKLKFEPIIEQRRREIQQMTSQEGMTSAKLHLEWTQRVDEFFVQLYSRALHRVFPPVFALCLCGSISRRETCPFSDLDSFLLVDDMNETDLNYFRRVGQEVDETLKEMGGGTTGFCLCKGGLHPINVIATPEHLLQELERIEMNDPNSHYLGIRDSPRFLFGKVSLFKKFTQLLEASKKIDPVKSKTSAMNNLKDLIKSNRFAIPKPTVEHINIKESLYRPVQLLLKDLCDYFGVTANEGRAQIVALVKAEAMSMTVANFLINYVEDVGKLRIDTHLKAKKEQDNIILVGKAQEPSDVVADGPTKVMVGRCLQWLGSVKVLLQQFIDEFGVERSKLKAFFKGKPKNPWMNNQIPPG